jgi:effector-binding domain-containing protein
MPAPPVRVKLMSQVVVRFETMQPRVTAVIAEMTTWQQFPRLWPRLLDEVYRFVRPRPELATGAAGEMWQNVMLYRDDQPSFEVGVLVSRRFEPEGRVIASELPGGEVAVATHRGDYGRLAATHAAVRDHVAATGRGLAGPRWEIYGHPADDSSELETEVLWLLG